MGSQGDDWHWRFSLAEIAADGPFSTFPHVDRLLTVVAGAGIALTIDGAPPRFLDQGDDIAFTGEAGHRPVHWWQARHAISTSWSIGGSPGWCGAARGG